MENVDPQSGASPAAAAADPQLLAFAKSIDAQVGPVAGGVQEAANMPSIPLEREIAGMFAMIGAGAGQFLPSVKLVLDEAACKQLGDVLAPLARKYGLDRHLAGFKWRLEVQALFVVVPLALAVKGAVEHDLAQIRAAAAAAERGADPLGAGASSPAQASDKAPMLEPLQKAA